jgi:hypothetical protein
MACIQFGCTGSKKYGKYCIRHINGDVTADNYNDFFRECLWHGRHRSEIKTLLQIIYACRDTYRLEHNLTTFDQVYQFVSTQYGTKPRVGPLFKYDVTTQLCRYYGIIIDKVYIVGSGPKKNAFRLNLTLKTNPITDLSYAEASEVINKLGVGYIDKAFGTLSDKFIGDDLETILCAY